MNPNKQVIQIPIEDLIPNRFQPRIEFDEKALNDLANSIKQHGIIQPIVVRRLNDKFEIIAGERRFKAAKIAGLVSVPGIIAEVNDQSSAEMALIENVQRKDLSAIEEAKSYKNILDSGDMTQDDLAKKMGLSQSAVANKLRLLNLDDEVQDALLKGKISERHARSLLALDKKEQKSLLNRILDERLTVRQLDTIIKDSLNPSNDDEMDDVPLVNINEDLEEIQKEATDINPITEQKAHLSVENNTDNQFSTSNRFIKFQPSTNNGGQNIFNNPKNETNQNEFFNFGKQLSDENNTTSSFQNSSIDFKQETTDLKTSEIMPKQPDYFNFDSKESIDDLGNLSLNSNNDISSPMDNVVEEVLDVAPEAIDNLDNESNINIFDNSLVVSNDNYFEVVNEIKSLIDRLKLKKDINMKEENLDSLYKITIEINKE